MSAAEAANPTATRTEKERKRVGAAQRDRRFNERDIKLPPVKDSARRAACVADVFLFLTTYWPTRYFDPWTPDQIEMVRAILHCARYGGDQAIAAPRGGGKTSITEGVIAYCMLIGLLRFPVIIGANATEAGRVFENIKKLFEQDGDILEEDFPEVVIPIRALEGAPSRGNMQTVGGAKTDIEWTSKLVILPTVEGSPASGAALMYRGLNAAIRGCKVGSLRPDFVLLDDPETYESANNERQVADREKRIDSEVAGLGAPGKRLGRVALVTIMNRYCLAFRLTDRSIRPSWLGKRYRFMVTKPVNGTLWDEYLALLRKGQESGNDEDGRGAMEFYRQNRVAMDEGAEVSNPHRYDKESCKDGTPMELSAIQFYYNEIYRKSQNYADCELDNDPPEESGPQESGITAELVSSRVNHLPQSFVPPGTLALTAFIDLGKRACHWGIVAWREGATGSLINYGVAEVNNPDRGLKKALLATLLSWRDLHVTSQRYVDRDQKPRRFDVILVDCGAYDDAVYEFISQVGKPFRPSKGFGKGYEQSPFNAPQKKSKTRRPGNHWFESKQANKHWLVCMDADHWKGFCHERWMTPTFNEDGSVHRGSLSIYGSEPKEHFSLGKHQVAEVETEEFVPGKGNKRYWKVKNDNNHYLDMMYGNCVAGDMAGVRLLTASQVTDTKSEPRQAAEWFEQPRGPQGSQPPTSAASWFAGGRN